MKGWPEAGQDVLLVGHVLHLVHAQHVCLLDRLQRQELPRGPGSAPAAPARTSQCLNWKLQLYQSLITWTAQLILKAAEATDLAPRVRKNSRPFSEGYCTLSGCRSGCAAAAGRELLLPTGMRSSTSPEAAGGHVQRQGSAYQQLLAVARLQVWRAGCGLLDPCCALIRPFSYWPEGFPVTSC